MNKFLNGNINVQYGFTFQVHLQSRKIAIVIVQIIPLNIHLFNYMELNKWIPWLNKKKKGIFKGNHK
jgi:hypothetical protein